MIVVGFTWAVWLSVIASTVFPLLVGLVTTRATHPGVKAILLAALNVLTPFVASLADALANHTEWELEGALVLAITGFITSVALHYGLWKPTGVTAVAQANGRHEAE